MRRRKRKDSKKGSKITEKGVWWGVTKSHTTRKKAPLPHIKGKRQKGLRWET